MVLCSHLLLKPLLLCCAAPTKYTEPGCQGQVVNNATTKDMCPASVTYEPDFQDYVTFLSYGENTVHLVALQ